MKNIFSKSLLAAAFATLCLTSCDDDKNDVWGDFYGYQGGEATVENPKPRYIWVDAAANSPYLFNDRDNITAYINRCKDAGFTDILVDVRPTNGDVLYRTDKCEQANRLYTWVGSEYGAHERTATWDYLQAFIDDGHAVGLRVHAAFNTMVIGHPAGGGQGAVYRDPAKRDWVVVYNTADGLVNQLDLTGNTTCIHLNPAHPDAQEYLLGLLEDLTKYNVDGIVLDRGRYTDIRSDFSDVSRRQFEEYIGKTLTNWPEDVMPVGATDEPANRPRYYQKWIEYRAKTIHDFVVRAEQTVHSANRPIQFGCYVGAWYGSYYQNGVNWASPSYDPSTWAGTTWASADYHNYGYADHLDILILGCYAAPDKVYSTPGTVSMESYAADGYAKTHDACPLVIGGPDMGQFSTERHGISNDHLNALANSVDACINACDGYFLFDICHLQSSPRYWTYIHAGIDRYLGIRNPYAPVQPQD